MKPVFLLLAVLLAGCERAPEPVVTPPKDGVPTHVPVLAPQVEQMQRAKALDGQMQDMAEQQKKAIDDAAQ